MMRQISEGVGRRNNGKITATKRGRRLQKKARRWAREERFILFCRAVNITPLCRGDFRHSRDFILGTSEWRRLLERGPVKDMPSMTNRESKIMKLFRRSP